MAKPLARPPIPSLDPSGIAAGGIAILDRVFDRGQSVRYGDGVRYPNIRRRRCQMKFTPGLSIEGINDVA
jgi:hypothetical protein